MSIVIGIQTCNRVELTKQSIKSIIDHNSDAVHMPWVVSDDGSTDGTREYISSLPFINKAIFHPERSGITLGLKRLVDASTEYGEVLMYIQNDWAQVRYINFTAISEFFKNHPEAGHIQMIKFKGKDCKDRPSGSAMLINNYTKEKIISGAPICIDGETIIPGNWHYADIPGFTSLKYAKNMFSNILDEGERVRLLHESGCAMYLLDNQPFTNIDYTGVLRTKGGKH